MSSVADVPLAALYRDASPETAAAFVADLYEARGWAVDRTGERQLLVSADGHERRIGVVHPADSVPAADLVDWAETVVAPDGVARVPGDVDVVGADTLRRRLAYAVDRPVAREILESRFGWVPPQASGDSGGAPDGATTGNDGAGGAQPAAGVLGSPGGQSRVFLAALVVLAFAGGLAVVMAEQLDGGAQADTVPEQGAGTPAATATATPFETRAATATPTPMAGAADVDPSKLPPGVEQSGAIDRVLLTRAHESALENRSYRLTISYSETVDGRPVGVYTEIIRVENDTHYSATVTEHGRLRAPKPTLAETDVYADGSVRFERLNESTVERRTTLSYDRFLAGQSRFLAMFLDAGNSSVVDSESALGSATTYVVTEGNPATLLRNTRGGFHVRENGLVTRARWTYAFSRQLTEYDNVTASFGMRISGVGSTTVQRPDWVPDDASEPGGAPLTGASNGTSDDSDVTIDTGNGTSDPDDTGTDSSTSETNSTSETG